VHFGELSITSAGGLGALTKKGFFVMILKTIISTIAILFAYQTVFAQMSTSSSSTSASSMGMSTTTGTLHDVIEQKKIEDPHIITDTKLQADEGALTRYSVKSSLSYAGPGIGDLSNKNRPNPDGTPSPNQTNIGGSISARYRLDGVSAVSLGTGIYLNHPFNGMDRTDLSSPYVSYDRSSRFGDLQMRNILKGGWVTTPEYTKNGESASTGYEIDMVHNIGDSRFALGLDTKLDYFIYGRDYWPKHDKYNSAQNNVAFYPNLKYQFSDRLNVNTSAAFQYYNPRSSKNGWQMWNRTVTQTFGLGYSYRRDVYLSPYVTVYPNNWITANTTFNLAATFSLM
jgi:hypothetical protein